VLSQGLGREDLSFVEIEPMEVKVSDRLLLCSDGLTEELADEIIAEQLKLSQSCEQIASILIKEAKQREGRDNITVIVISVEPSSSVKN
jgi:protein phosphatase